MLVTPIFSGPALSNRASTANDWPGIAMVNVGPCPPPKLPLPSRSGRDGNIERQAERERERFCQLVFLGRKLESDVALPWLGQATRFNPLPQGLRGLQRIRERRRDQRGTAGFIAVTGIVGELRDLLQTCFQERRVAGGQARDARERNVDAIVKRTFFRGSLDMRAIAVIRRGVAGRLGCGSCRHSGFSDNPSRSG